MTQLTEKSSKKGNVTLVVISIFVVLSLTLGSFFKTTVSRKFSTNKIGDTLYARELANSLAMISVHNLKNEVKSLTSNNNDLESVLRLPYDKIEGKTGNFEIPNPAIKTLIENLKKTSGLKNVEIGPITWKIKNVKPILVDNKPNPPYACEKTGLIDFNFSISYKHTDGKTKTEDYTFSSEFKVVANLLPVLSKFTLYVGDALEGDPEKNAGRFNIVKTSYNGALVSQNVHPWILNNGYTNIDGPQKFEELVAKDIGFVYLGGGTKDYPVTLGLACGAVDEEVYNLSEYGEEFHFHVNENKEAGYWKVDVQTDSSKAIMAADVGFCYPNKIEPNGYEGFREQLGDLITNFRDVYSSRFNSLFRVYGTDIRKSPTLVFGFVDSSYVSIKEYRFGARPGDFEMLSWLNEEAFYDLMEDNFLEISHFQKDFAVNDYQGYKFYSSQLASSRYNNSYIYASSEVNRIQDPPPYENFDEGILKLCNSDYDENTLCAIPTADSAKYGDIFSNTKLNDDLETIIKKIIKYDSSDEKVKYERIAFPMILKQSKPNNEERLPNTIVTNDANIKNDFNKYLNSNGILLGYNPDQGNTSNVSLDLNGWLYIDNSDGAITPDIGLPLDFSQYSSIVSNGGIILSDGNIVIESDIGTPSTDLSNEDYSARTSPREDPHITIIALNGDIIVNGNVDTINASLVSANGQVILKSSTSNKPLIVNGNIVMKQITGGKYNFRRNMVRGLKLNYLNELAAIPYVRDGNQRSEIPLLMLNIKENPKLN